MNFIYQTFIFILLSSSVISGQNSLNKKVNVDSIIKSMNIKNVHDTIDLADTLTLQFATDSEKVRAIYFWMTQNISYDCKAFRSGTPVRLDGDVEAYYDKRVVRTLSTKKGVCEDYALLFSCLCRLEKIPCVIITGFALITKPSNLVELLGNNTSNHAWNAVKINKKWYLIDVTWASGYVNFGMNQFTRKLNDYYYLTPPENFILEHHPDDPKWQLLENPLDWKAFINNARYRERDK